MAVVAAAAAAAAAGGAPGAASNCKYCSAPVKPAGLPNHERSHERAASNPAAIGACMPTWGV